MKNKCAWCQINVDEQQRFTADISDVGHCRNCGSYNDRGQRSISINSMKQIYEGAILLMNKMAGEFSELLEIADVDIRELKAVLDIEEGEPLEISFYASEIVRTLFLSHTRNAGGTSTGNLMNLLGVKENDVSFAIGESGEEE